ncbi:MAG: hypothetical protein ACHBN1_15495 [Heteroscytonema crispum UTEX LB 1556]
MCWIFSYRPKSDTYGWLRLRRGYDRENQPSQNLIGWTVEQTRNTIDQLCDRFPMIEESSEIILFFIANFHEAIAPVY